MRCNLLPLLPALTLAVALSGCIEKVDQTASTSGENGGMMATLPATDGNAAAPQENNGRITPDANPPGPNAATTTAPPIPTTTGQPVPPKDKSELEKKVAAAEAKLAGSPNDPNLKKALATALYEQGQQIMYDDSIMPRQKYGPALKLFNRALALDPTNKGAMESKTTIEQIYRSMGRPVPQ